MFTPDALRLTYEEIIRVACFHLVEMPRAHMEESWCSISCVHFWLLVSDVRVDLDLPATFFGKFCSSNHETKSGKTTILIDDASEIVTTALQTINLPGTLRNHLPILPSQSLHFEHAFDSSNFSMRTV